MLFNDSWTFYRVNDKDNRRVVTLPHDAMLEESRDISNPSSISGAYFKGNDYVYEKEFIIDDLNEGERVLFHFEGVYHNGEFFINDKKVCERHYGYSDFYFDVTENIIRGKNIVKVFVHNADQPNSRWYSGAGIYRNVHLEILKKYHVIPRSIIIKTLSYKEGLVNIGYSLNEGHPSSFKIFDKDNKEVLSSSFNEKEVNAEITINNPHLWDDEHPYLYKLVIYVDEEEYPYSFGIREIELNEERGLLVNGKRVLLRGCCIHADSGMLGSKVYSYSERRKVRIIKEAGFNAIRSAHNPCSEDLIKACDESGVYLIDEYADCWFIHKTQYDYASYCENDYPEDIKDMVERDRIHPSVIMYSTGNEVGETAFKKGIELTDTFTKYIHELDKGSLVTCGINVFFNGIAHTPFSQYSDKKAFKKQKEQKVKEGGSSAFFNNLAGLLGSEFMKNGARLPIVDRYTKEAFSKLDVAGYNYGLYRYKHDLKKYPHRFILGSETFPSDAGKFYAVWKDNPRLLGDFIWSGMDYIGEVSIGAMLSVAKCDYREDISGWLLSSTGVIDILGNETSQSDFIQCGFRHKITRIGVVSPQEYKVKHSPSAWRFTNAIPYWNFPGYENKKCMIQVYSSAYRTETYINGKLIADKKIPVKSYVNIKTTYVPGELKVISYDEKGNVTDTYMLTSGKKASHIQLIREDENATMDDLIYLHILSVDEEGNIDPVNEKSIEISEVKNGTLIALGSSIPYNKEGYNVNNCKTYYGRAMAIIKPCSKGEITLKIKSDDEEKSFSFIIK